MRQWRYFPVSCLVGLALILSIDVSLAKTKILVFAAASLGNVMPELVREYERNCDCQIATSFAGSGTLARQIKAGAPADIFISANQQWFEQLLVDGYLIDDQWIHVAGNQLVIAGGNAQKEIDAAILGEILGGTKFAMGDPLSVPAGIYAQQALKNMGIWNDVSGNAIYGENVRVSLKMTARGDVQNAIVYASDVLLEPDIKVRYRFSAGSHDRIIYPAGTIAKSDGNLQIEAEKFLQFLGSPTAGAIFRRYGFGSCDDASNCGRTVGQ